MDEVSVFARVLRRIALLVGTLVVLGAAAAAEPAPGFLSGRVEDASTGKGLPFTNISFAASPDSPAASLQAVS
jgi:hypothetical protein